MILINPFHYLEYQGIECKKRYYLWVINTCMDETDKDVVQEYVKFAKRKYITEFLVKKMGQYRLTQLFSRLK